MNPSAAREDGHEMFVNLESRLTEDSDGELAQKMIAYLAQAVTEMRAQQRELGSAAARAQATALVDALDAAQTIVGTIWSNFHPGRRLQ